MTAGAAGASSERPAVPGGGAGVVIGLLGPTGSGKTEVAIELAKRLGCGVISCDSMQVYRGFAVLTNQPDSRQLAQVDHRMIGFVEPGTSYSAAEYASAAAPLVEADLSVCGRAVVAGGTGLYMRAALAPLAVAPAADLELRRLLEARAEVEGPQSLHEELAGLDPEAAAAVDPRNLRRIIRALEVVLGGRTGWSGRDDLWKPSYYHRTLLVGLELDRAELYRRIDRRSQELVEGALEEVGRYREAAGRERAGAPVGIEAAIGFQEIALHLDGRQSLDETAQQVASATRRYARRQLTWLRKLEDLVRIDVQDSDASRVADTIMTLLASGEHVKEPQVS